MLRLPLELLLLIFDLAGPSDLLQLRATSKALWFIATPPAFRTLRCTSSGRSTANLVHLLRSSICTHVREIEYRDWYSDIETRDNVYGADERGAGQNLVAALKLLQGLPAVHTLSFTFYPSFEEESEYSEDDFMAVGGIFGSDESDDEGDDADADVDFHNDEEGFEEDDDVYDEESLEDDVYPEHSDMGDSDSDDDSNDEAIPCATQQLILQLYVFKTLAALSPAPALRSLTLCNLIAFGDDIFVLPSFLSLFRGLAHLHISTLSDVENGAHDHRLLEFYMDSLPPMLRAPALSLTSLTLHADQDVDFDLSGLHYPYLKLLSLQRVLFGTETDAEDFILAHGSTLTSLSLLRCKITVPDGERAPSRSWVDVYGNFSAQLVCLRRLEVVEEWEDEGQPNWSSGGRKVRYVWPEPGWGWNPYFPGHVKRDKRALESFRQAVQLRNAW